MFEASARNVDLTCFYDRGMSVVAEIARNLTVIHGEERCVLAVKKVKIIRG